MARMGSAAAARNDPASTSTRSGASTGIRLRIAAATLIQQRPERAPETQPVSSANYRVPAPPLVHATATWPVPVVANATLPARPGMPAGTSTGVPADAREVPSSETPRTVPAAEFGSSAEPIALNRMQHPPHKEFSPRCPAASKPGISGLTPFSLTDGMGIAQLSASVTATFGADPKPAQVACGTHHDAGRQITPNLLGLAACLRGGGALHAGRRRSDGPSPPAMSQPEPGSPLKPRHASWDRREVSLRPTFPSPFWSRPASDLQERAMCRSRQRTARR